MVICTRKTVRFSIWVLMYFCSIGFEKYNTHFSKSFQYFKLRDLRRHHLLGRILYLVICWLWFQGQEPSNWNWSKTLQLHFKRQISIYKKNTLWNGYIYLWKLINDCKNHSKVNVFTCNFNFQRLQNHNKFNEGHVEYPLK